MWINYATERLTHEKIFLAFIIARIFNINTEQQRAVIQQILENLALRFFFVWQNK